MSPRRTFDIDGVLAAAEPTGPATPPLDALRFDFQQALRDAEGPPPTPPVLTRLIDRAAAALSAPAKDLLVASWAAEALLLRDGLAGLRDGLALVGGIVAAHWETCLPEIGEDGDEEARSRALLSLASPRNALLAIRRRNLAEPGREVPPLRLDDLPRGRPPTPADLTAGPAGEAIRRSTRKHFEQALEDAEAAKGEAQALNRAARGAFQEEPPDLEPLVATLEEARAFLAAAVAVKRRQEPRPDDPVEEELPEDQGTGGGGPSPERHDYGRALIAFSERAKELADAAQRLKQIRDERGELHERIVKLDAEYREVAAKFAADPDFGPLLARGPRRQDVES